MGISDSRVFRNGITQEKILKLFQNAYPQPTGLEARAYRVVKSDPDDDYKLMPGTAPLRYSVTTYYLHYWCFKGKPHRSHETGTWIECYVNSLWQFMEPLSSDEFLLPNGQQLFYLPHIIGEMKGYPVYSTQTDLSDNRRESILILPDKRLPVRAVSREEFVRSLQRYIQRFLKENDETTRLLEAGLKESLAFADKSASFKTETERTKYKEDNRRSVENGRLKRDQTAQEFRVHAQRLEAMLAALSPQERTVQAVIFDPYGLMTNRRGLGTFAEQAVKGRPVVTHDLHYYDPGLTRPAIQSIQLLLKYETAADMVAKRELMRQFRQNIDLDGFKALLDRKAQP
ncbi:MAG: hypothetical protein EOP50_19380 [Sphingobacteriales bacterium]|nr:MAG: hypothetical protein EOP50_19380 [Sphingobacteriales bacterium]